MWIVQLGDKDLGQTPFLVSEMAAKGFNIEWYGGAGRIRPVEVRLLDVEDVIEPTSD